MGILEKICEPLADNVASLPKSEEYQKLLREFSKQVEVFEPTLSNPQKKMILELEAQRNLIAAMDEDFMFFNGFRIGAAVIFELLRPLSLTK